MSTDAPRDGRAATNASLLQERSKTDGELARVSEIVEQDASRRRVVARDLADSTLRDARHRADQDSMMEPVVRGALHPLHEARRAEDAAVAGERAAASEQLAVEREERRRMVALLLQLERGATDERLVAERVRADQALGARDEFLGMVSHDLRSMLGGISLSTDILTKEAAGDGERGVLRTRTLARIERLTQRMNRLLGDLLDVVSLEAGALRVVAQPLDGSHLLRDTAEAFQPSFAAKGIVLTTRVESDTLVAELDHERILQVLANLLTNALKFTPPGGEVAVLAAADGPFVRFSVTDTGSGVPAAQAEAIFERFAQGTANDRRGLGLGLYISKCIVQAHGGRIWLELPATGGSAFHFTLPAVHPQSR